MSSHLPSRQITEKNGLISVRNVSDSTARAAPVPTASLFALRCLVTSKMSHMRYQCAVWLYALWCLLACTNSELQRSS